jgi:tRNA(fMet)-specific endonuclease VapC
VLRYLLDTNTVIYVIKKRPIEVLEVFNTQAGHMAISAITLSELLHGAEKSERPAANLAVVEDFCSRIEVLSYAPKASLHYGSIRATLERAGTPIGVNDLHIAAHARSEGLTLVTNNEREFVRVPALQIENWLRDVEKSVERKKPSSKRKPTEKIVK